MCLRRISTIQIQVYNNFNCDLISCTTPACFSTFYQSTMVSILVENQLEIYVILLCSMKLLNFYLVLDWKILMI